MDTLIQAIKTNSIKGCNVEDVRSYDGFCMTDNKMSRIICLELKIDGKWNPLKEPEFNDKKACVATVKEIKKYWREN